jgi:hypothetical protein
MFPFNCDKDGISVIFLRIRVNLKIPKLSTHIKDFIAYILNKIDQQNNENGFVLVFDLTDAGIRNADLDLCFYLISLLRHYFPEGMYNLLKIKLIRDFISSEMNINKISLWINFCEK